MSPWRGGRSFEETPHLTQSAQAMLDELAWWTKALKAAREGAADGRAKAAA